MSMEGMDMGSMPKTSHGGGMTMPGMEPSGDMPHRKPSDDNPHMEHMQHGPEMQPMQDMPDMPGMGTVDQRRLTIPGAEPVKHSPDDHGPGNQTVAEYSQNRMGEPGRGLEDSDRRVLLYTDLKSLVPYPDQREPEREIEFHLTGQMTRYMWSFDGKTYSEAREPIHFRYRSEERRVGKECA